jgi:hypothetical protein
LNGRDRQRGAGPNRRFASALYENPVYCAAPSAERIDP